MLAYTKNGLTSTPAGCVSMFNSVILTKSFTLAHLYPTLILSLHRATSSCITHILIYEREN